MSPVVMMLQNFLACVYKIAGKTAEKKTQFDDVITTSRDVILQTFVFKKIQGRKYNLQVQKLSVETIQ